ncbi:hypothetical protein QFZ75_005182 [Streptomyces sp. V3I8]|uniref:hypothetical protein n=1 Tax=Streptomyces sp. V3I8 TaxID=3042279 RepID=UPI00278AC131|nr:hypothetical protein [Streptomyces sp. V3I8]MDQ1038766.1 hypothetical protein [Streptomyces sp. V3I8]
MTKARILGTPVQARAGVGKLPAALEVEMGRYTYTPASAYSAPGARGSLHGDGASVELSVTETLLGDLLDSLNSAQDELDQRWGAQGRPGGNVACA